MTVGDGTVGGGKLTGRSVLGELEKGSGTVHDRCCTIDDRRGGMM